MVDTAAARFSLRQRKTARGNRPSGRERLASSDRTP